MLDKRKLSKEEKENLILPALVGGTTGLVVLSLATGNPIPLAVAVPIPAVAAAQDAIREINKAKKETEKRLRELI